MYRCLQVHYNAVYQAEDGDLVKAELQSCQDPKAVELYKAKRTKKVDQCNKVCKFLVDLYPTALTIESV